MNPQVKIEVIDKDGWRKEFSFQKSLFHIGSAAVNDLVLENARGGGVAARHAQLIALPDGSGFRLVNLGDTDILLNEAGDKLAPPHSVATVSDGSVIKVGDFTLIFHGAAMMIAAAPAAGRSSHIGLRLSLPRTKVAPHQNLAGVLAVANHGDQTGVQFDLDLEGLEPDCYNIEPAPLLSSGSEREVALRIFHRGDKPAAGDHTVTIRAVAPDAYPGEEASVTCTIQVQPFYKHTLRPAVSGQPSAVSHQPEMETARRGKALVPPSEDLLPPTIPARSVQPAAVSGQPSAGSRQPAAISRQPEMETATTMTPERPQVLTLKAAPQPGVQAQPPKVAAAPSASEDWWAAPEIPAPPPATVEVKAKAVPAPGSTVLESLPAKEPDIEVPASLYASVEPETAPEAEVAVETPTAPPVEMGEPQPPETAAGVDEVVEEAVPLNEEPEATPDVPPIEEPVTALIEAIAVAEPVAEVETPPEQGTPPSGDQPERATSVDDDWWGATEEPPIPVTPVVKIVPPVEIEPTPEAKVTPPQADDWWSETTDTGAEKKETSPGANEDWWSA